MGLVFEKREKRKNGGFTMVEVLAVAAIMIILIAFGFVEIVKHSRHMQVTEMDNMARSIYLAAENRAVTLARSGRLTDSLAAAAGTAGGGDLVASGSTDKLYYIKSPAANLSDLIPAGIIEPTLRDASFYIVYDVGARCVKDVFYDAKTSGENFAAAFSADVYGLSGPGDFKTFYQYWSGPGANTSRQMRADNKIYIGYYGGKADAPPPPIDESGSPGSAGPIEVIPKIDIVNGEKLEVHVTYAPKDDAKINGWELEVGLTYGSKDKRVLLPLEKGVKSTNGDECTYTWTLDAVGGPHFKDWVWKKDDGITDMTKEEKEAAGVDKLGGYFTIDAQMVKKEGFEESKRANLIATKVFSKKKNSLFDEASNESAGRAIISNLRHLQNLDEKFSGVLERTEAYQVADINANEMKDKDGNVISYDYVFQPINNSQLTSYKSYVKDPATGECYSIKNLTVTEASSAGKTGAGLFAEVKGTVDPTTGDNVPFKFENVWLINASVDGGSLPTGSLVGTAANAEFTGCRVYWDAPGELEKDGKVEYKIQSSDTAGGLVGTLNGGKINGSFAATTIQGSKNIGGLIGNASNTVTIDKAYADCYIKGESADLRAGGLIGKSEGNTTLTNVYSSGFIEWTETTNSSVVAGFCASGSVEATNAYSGVYYQGTGDHNELAGGSAKAFGPDVTLTEKCYAAWGTGSNKGYEGLKGLQSTLGSAFESKNNSASSHPYRLGKNSGLVNYELPGIVGLPHYGDWANGNQGGMPVVWVVNGEELQAKIITKGGRATPGTTPTFTMPRVKLVYGDNEVEIGAGKIQYAGYREVSSTETEVLLTVTLDTLKPGGPRFKDFWKSASSKPSYFGGDFSVLASADGSTWTKKSATSSNNSLFAGGTVSMKTVEREEKPVSESSDATVYIENLRHLQNLDSVLSNVSETKTKAVQTADIDAGVRKNNDGKRLDAAGNPVDDSAAVAPYVFKPIANRNLQEYTVQERKDADGNVLRGQYWKISNLQVKTDSDAGLFAEVCSSVSDETTVPFKFNNVSIDNAAVESSGNNAGVLVGNAKGIVVLNNCKTNAATVTGGIAGGLIGNAIGDVKFNNCKTNATTVTGGIAGGLIGNADRTVKFDDKCAVGSVVDREVNGSIIGGTAAGGLAGTVGMPSEITNYTVKSGIITAGAEGGAAGGLVGSVSALSGITLDSCNVVGTSYNISITAAGKAGGLLGDVKGTANLTNCQVYWTGYDDTNKNTIAVQYKIVGASAGGLAGSIDNGAITNSFAATFVNGTADAGGLIGSVTGTMAVSNSYADCYLKGNKAGGLIGSVADNGNVTLTNVYSAGFIELADSGAGGGLCASSSGKITAGNAYAAMHYTPSAATQPLAPDVQPGINNCYYVDYNGSQSSGWASYKDMTVKSGGKITVNVETGKKTDTVANLLGAAFASPGITYPYNLAYEARKNAGEYPDSKQYPLPMLKDTAGNLMSHYGDWKVEPDVPEVRIINGDELVAVIVTKSVTEPHVKLIYGSNWVFVPAKRIMHEADENWIKAMPGMLGGLTVPAGGAAWTVTLDTLKPSGPRFNDCTKWEDWRNLDGTPAYAPTTFGGDFSVEASYDGNSWSIGSDASTNSLFAKVQPQKIEGIDATAINYANIENLRHLQNLDAAFSGVAGIKGAAQKKDINAGVLRSYKGEEMPYQFIPIVNSELTRYSVDNKKDLNGADIPNQYCEISNLRVTATSSANKDGAGLFGTVGGQGIASFVFKGVTLTNAIVGKTEEETEDIRIPDAGAIVGQTWGDISFSNCTVSGGSVRSFTYAGGMAGYLGSHAKITASQCKTQNVTVQGSLAVGGFAGYLTLKTYAASNPADYDSFTECDAVNTTVQSIGSNTSVGGLLGQADAEINMENSKSYWDTSTLPLTDYKFADDLSSAPLPKIEGFNAGGLIGNLRNKGLIKNSFAATYVMGYNTMGGLIGVAERSFTTIVDIYSCYADCYMDITKSNAASSIGGLIGQNGLTVNIYTAYVAGFFRGTNAAVTKVNGLCGNNSGMFKVTSAYNTINNVCGTNTVIDYKASEKVEHNKYYYGTTLDQISTLVDSAFTGQTVGTVGLDGRTFTPSPSTVNPYGLAGSQGTTYPYPGLKAYVGDNQFTNALPARPHYGDWQYVAPQ